MRSRSNINLFPFLFVLFYLFSFDYASGQERSTKIKFRDNAAILSGNNKDSKLQIQIFTGTEFEKTPYLITGLDTTYSLEKVETYRYEQFKKSDFSRLAVFESFRASVEQNGNKLFIKLNNPYFSERALAPYMSEKGIEDYDLIFEIPENSSISLNHSSLSLGMMSVPVKMFRNPKVNLLDDPDAEPLNLQLLSVFNINAFVGVKFFKKNYTYINNKQDAISSKDTGRENSPAFSLNTFLGMSRNRVQISSASFEEDFNSLSYGLTLGLQYGPLVGFLSSGFDTHFADDFITERFQNNLWIGFGIGLGI